MFVDVDGLHTTHVEPLHKDITVKASESSPRFRTVFSMCWIKIMIFEKTELTEFLSKNEGILLAIY